MKLIIFFLLLINLRPSFIYAFDLKNYLVTYQDANYHNPSTKYKAGGTVYLRFASSSDGSVINQIWLLSDKKEKIKQISVQKSGERNYLYTGFFQLPEKTGQYYLSINLKGKGSSFSFQQNLTSSKFSQKNSDATTHFTNLQKLLDYLVSLLKKRP